MKSTTELLRLASKYGWAVELTRRGHLRLSKPGRPLVIASPRSSDPRNRHNVLADMRRAERAVSTS